MRAIARPLRSSGSRLGSESGQAVLEYLLVLFVTVAIILGIMYQFNTAFKKYVQSYFGEYVACLLETGEMPSLGGDGGANATSCASNFEPFSLKNGRPLSGGSGGGGNGDDSRSDKARGKNGGDKSNFSRSRNASLRAAKIPKGRNTRNADGSSGGGGSGSDDDKKKISRRAGAAPGGSYSMRTQRMRDQGQIPISGSFTMGGMKKDSKPFTARVAAGKKGAAGGSRSGKKLMIDPKKFRTVASDDGSLELGLSFGDYIRYIIIFGIIIMIVVFFGGQLFQLKKGWNNN